MRMKCRRNIISYIISVTLFSFLVTLYVIGLRQNKQIGTNFNLKPVRFKVRRDVHSSKKEVNNLSKSLVNSQKGNINTKEQRKEHFGVILDKKVQPSTIAPQYSNITFDRPLNVYIVEEHHEVIPYWFGAARRGIIPKAGNVLIHIDGHSDMYTAEVLPEYPLFRWPSDKQLIYLMQRNDAFIQAAAMAGLIDRVIWVWPDWDLPNHDQQYTLSTYSLGWAYVISPEKQKTKHKTFCFCIQNNGYRECMSVQNAEKEKTEEDESGFKIQYKNCRIKKQVIVEEVHEQKMLQYLTKSDWLKDNKNIMLDIDEDYYGCTYAIEPLLKTNMSYEKIYQFDETVAANLCPASATHEKESDYFLMQLIGSVRIKRACAINPNLKNSTKCLQIIKIDLLHTFSTLLTEKVAEKSINLCPNVSQAFIHNLLSQMGKLRITQLHALQKTGFCSITSTKTLKNQYNDKFGICFGANTPKNTQIFEHSPTKNEIIKRTMLLKQILKKIKYFSPNIVTVCRSVRDGYTPRNYFELIESSIITALNRTMDRNLSLHYDRDLIGGKPGWPSRHKA
ncbi:hypothetical protein ACF0H5_000891 [Mactra antiquata]